MSRRKFFSMVLIVLVVALLLAPGAGTKVARADCTFGDIICDMQQALQQLIDSYVNPLKDWLTFQTNKTFYAAVYNVEESIASALWSVSKAIITVGVGIGVITDWISTHFFQPMIATSNQTFQPITGMVFFVAMIILGCTYMLSAIIRLNIVSLRNMLLWYIAGILFFQIGPSFYASMDSFRQQISSYFYASSITAVQNQSPFQQLANGDNAASSAVYGMSQPCSNFPSFIQTPSGTVSGMDIALAYQKADGYDVVSGGTRCLGGGTEQSLPRVWFNANGFFDQDKSPDTWIMPVAPQTVDDVVANMLAAVIQAFGGISRLFDAIPLVWFGVVEQLVALCLTIAQGLTFISFGCAILFAFFRRTEPIAWAIFDQWIGLIIQTVVIAIVQAMIVALYMSASYTGSPLITLAVSVVGLVLMTVLLVSGIRAVWSAFNRLFEAFGQATGGVIISTGQATQGVVSAAATAGSLAISGGSAALGGIGALGSGATWAQAAGVAFGGSRALDGAAFSLARLPGLRDTALGEAANQFVEGSATRRVGDSLLGPLGGAVLGPALLTDRNPDHEQAYVGDNGQPYWRAPMLSSRVGDAMNTLLSGPTWEQGDVSNIGRGGRPLPLRREDLNDEAERESGGRGLPATFLPLSGSVSLNNDGDFDETLDDDMKRDLAGYGMGGQTAGDPRRLESAASTLESAASGAGNALTHSAEALGRSVQSADTQRKMEQVEGRMNVTGANNIADVLANAVNMIQKQNAVEGHVGADNRTVSLAMAGAMGIEPVEREGKLVAPIERNVPRFQMFTDQALQMGLSPQSVREVVREVKSNPEGQLSAPTRETLIAFQHDRRGEAWQDSLSHVQKLEHAARILPNDITAYGARTAPLATDAAPAKAQTGSTTKE